MTDELSGAPSYAKTASTAYRRPGGDRLGRAAHRRGDPQRAGRPARVAQADRQRELRLARRAADDGHLAVGQVRRGHRSGTASTPAARTSTPSSSSPPSTPASCSARRTPTCSRTRASTPTSSPSGRSSPSASRRRRWSRPGAKHVNDLSEADWEQLRHDLGNQRAARHVAGRRRPPDARLPARTSAARCSTSVSYGTDPETGLLDYDAVRATGPGVQAADPHRRLLGLPAPGQLRHDARDRRRGRRDADGRHGALRRAGRRQGVHRRLRPGAARPRRHHHDAQVAARPARRHGAVPAGVRRRRRPRLPDGARRPARRTSWRPRPSRSPRPGSPSFQTYAQRVADNASALAEGFLTRGATLVTGGTDNHLVLLDVSSFGLTGRQAESALLDSGIVTNRNSVPRDPNGAWYTSGIRIGTPGADHARLRRRRVRPGRRADRRRAHQHHARHRQGRRAVEGEVHDRRRRRPAHPRPPTRCSRQPALPRPRPHLTPQLPDRGVPVAHLRRQGTSCRPICADRGVSVGQEATGTPLSARCGRPEAPSRRVGDSG